MTPPLGKLLFVNAAEILNTLRELTERKEIEFLLFAKDLEKLPRWQPAARYIQVLSEGTKPETASEDLFTALFKELLKIEPSRQVTVRDGWVDFRVREPNARPIPFELKALFTGTFTFGSGATKAELDEIIRQSLKLWPG